MIFIILYELHETSYNQNNCSSAQSQIACQISMLT